jgi:hypothetical protein
MGACERDIDEVIALSGDSFSVEHPIPCASAPS